MKDLARHSTKVGVDVSKTLEQPSKLGVTPKILKLEHMFAIFRSESLAWILFDSNISYKRQEIVYIGGGGFYKALSALLNLLELSASLTFLSSADETVGWLTSLTFLSSGNETVGWLRINFILRNISGSFSMLSASCSPSNIFS